MKGLQVQKPTRQKFSKKVDLFLNFKQTFSSFQDPRKIYKNNVRRWENVGYQHLLLFS